MLPYFEWSLPTRVVLGNGTIKKTGELVKNLGKKCFLVTGRSSAEKQGYLKAVTDQLTAQKISCFHYKEVSPNPRSTEVDAAAELIRQEKCDFVLALGGGSVMDASKAIAMLAKNPGNIWEYMYKGPGKKFKRFNTALPIVMVPTLAATGSELNSGAIISNPATREKTGLFGEALYPKLTIIDPQLTWSAPYDSTVDGAVDIICHVLEMYLSTTEDDYLQDQISLAITKTVKRALDILKGDLKNSEARAQLSWASSLALCGVATNGRHGDFPMHDIEHALSGRCEKLAHGRGLATIFLNILEYDKEAVTEKIVQLSKYVFDEPLKDVNAALKKWVKWFADHRTGGSLKEYLGQENPEDIAGQILAFSGTPDFLPNVRDFSKDDLVNFVKKLYF